MEILSAEELFLLMHWPEQRIYIQEDCHMHTMELIFYRHKFLVFMI